MRKVDILVIAIIVIVLAPFFVFPDVYEAYKSLNAAHPLWMAFLKFGILATFGEMLGLRIKTGRYTAPKFGIAPRAVVWGLLGVWIALAMGVFSIGIPAYLSAKFDIFKDMAASMSGPFSGTKLLGAFFISTMMNCSFAPVFMTVHKITDAHILRNEGRIGALLKPIPVTGIITGLDWRTQWSFVFKRTIPLFWIPAHTITFILPPAFQVLFAAFCSIVLGLILSLAAMMAKKA